MPSVFMYVSFIISRSFSSIHKLSKLMFINFISRLNHTHGPDSSRAASWPAGAMVISIAALLGLALFVIFFS
jgi:multicomponent Na+:H+ antiporter subunit D